MPSVQQSLAAVMADVQAVRKTDRNQQQGFNFRGIDAVVNAVGPALRKHAVLVLPTVVEFTQGTVEVGRNRTPMGHVTVKVQYTFVGPEGDTLAATVVGEAMDSGDKAVAKAMSVAFRTALLQSLALPTDEPDPDASSYERAAPAAQSTSKRAVVTEQSGADQSVVDAMLRTLEVLETADGLAQVADNLRTLDLTEGQRESLVAAYQAAKARIGA